MHALLSCRASPSSDAVVKTQGDDLERQLCFKWLFQKQLPGRNQPNPWGTLWGWGAFSCPEQLCSAAGGQVAASCEGWVFALPPFMTRF